MHSRCMHLYKQRVLPTNVEINLNTKCPDAPSFQGLTRAWTTQPSNGRPLANGLAHAHSFMVYFGDLAMDSHPIIPYSIQIMIVEVSSGCNGSAPPPQSCEWNFSGSPTRTGWYSTSRGRSIANRSPHLPYALFLKSWFRSLKLCHIINNFYAQESLVSQGCKARLWNDFKDNLLPTFVVFILPVKQESPFPSGSSRAPETAAGSTYIGSA